MSSIVYTGPWINWSAGRVQGATLTLSRRDGGFLTTFIATFITIVGAQLWHILTFAIHQIRSSARAEDGLHHQQQNILRNTATPAGAAWLFILQSRYWKGRVARVAWRTLPLAMLCALYLLLFAGAAILSSQISEVPGTARLLSSNKGKCGYWGIADDSTNESAFDPFQLKTTSDSIVSSVYARSCYGDNSSPLSCSTFPVPVLEWTSTPNHVCPFQKAACRGGESPAVEMATKYLHSREDLGINLPDSQSVKYRLKTTCSPLETSTFVHVDEGTGGEYHGTLFRYYYGKLTSSNYTYLHNGSAEYTAASWSIAARYASPGETGGWQPDKSLKQNDSHISIVFIASNSLLFSEPYDDPVFDAHRDFGQTPVGPRYQMDKIVAPIACVKQQQICNPLNDLCTPLVADLIKAVTSSDIGLNVEQKVVASRIARASVFTTVYNVVNNRGGASLLISDLVVGRTQYTPPAGQWIRECEGWFTTGLAQLQQTLQEYASGPTNIREGLDVKPPFSRMDWDMCVNQIVNDTQNTTSFSILGILIVFVLGGIIILASFFLEPLVGFVQKHLRVGEHKRLSWVMGDKLMLHRQVFEMRQPGRWEDGVEQWPVTTRVAGLFESWEVGQLRDGGLSTDVRSDGIKQTTGVYERAL